MGNFTEAHYRERRRDVFAMAREEAPELDVLLVSDPVGVRYLTGLREGSRHLLVHGEEAWLITGGMFRDLAEEESVAAEVLSVTPPFSKAAADAAAARGWDKIALVDRCTTMADWKSWIAACGEERLALVRDVVLARRAVKDSEEIALIREAVEIAEEAFEDLVSREVGDFVGETEKDLALHIEMLMQSSGADDQAFPNGVILASGPNSFVCHHVPKARRIEAGDVVLIDWGAVVEGYRSDLTRMVSIGPPPDQMRDIHAVVKRAVEAAIGAIRPGVMTQEIDTVARNLIAEAGYGEDDFRHGTGHGIGLEIHESPRFMKDAESEFNRALEPGMVMTVEPGIYLKGIGGVRLETDVLVTEDGCEDLCALDFDWVVLE